MKISARVISFTSMVALMAVVLQACSSDAAQDQGSIDEGSPVAIQFDYPEEWQTTLPEAQTKARFSLLIPTHEAANADNVTETFANGDGTVVAMRFPRAAKPSAPVRQDFIEIYEEPWQGGNLTPEEAWSQTLEQYPGVAEIRQVLDTPVLVGKPHSDETGENPSHVEFVLDGVDVEIFGGDDSELLVEIAETMIRDAGNDRSS